MNKEVFFKCPHSEHPTVNVVNSLIIGEIQIHQGSNWAQSPPTLRGSMERDVISMSIEQSVIVAKQILKFAGETA